MSAPQPPQNLACLRFSNPHVEHRMLNFPRQTIVGFTLSYRHGIVRRTARLTFPSHVEFSKDPRGFQPVVDGHFRRASMSGKADGGASGITLISPEEPTRRTCGLRRPLTRARFSGVPDKGTGAETGPYGNILCLASDGAPWGRGYCCPSWLEAIAAVGAGASERTPKHTSPKLRMLSPTFCITAFPGHAAAHRSACGPRTAIGIERFCTGAFRNAPARQSRNLESLAPRSTARPQVEARRCISLCRERLHIGRAGRSGRNGVASGMTAANRWTMCTL
jgi:hypothetical protein